MNWKDIIPGKIKRAYNRLKWFGRNYQSIKPNSKLLSNHFLGPITYNTDSLTTSNNADFIKNPRFASAYSAAAATNPWNGFTLQWRVYIVCWFADYVKSLDGDFVECGVNTGAYARAIIDYVNFNSLGKTFYLLDTFEGLPEHLMKEEEIEVGNSRYGGSHYKDVYHEVCKTFSSFNTKIIKGVVPDTLLQCSTEKICYLSIDMNMVEPEIAAANYFWDKVVPGGVIILDDYGFPMHIFQKIAFDQFAKEKGVEILCLPTGQGIILKK